MKKGWWKFWTIVILVPLLAGCWSNRPVELRSMVLAIGFSPAPHGRIRVTVQIPTKAGLTSLTGGGAKSGGTGTLDYTLAAEGLTPGMALTRIQSNMQTDLYLGQVQLVVLSSTLHGSRLRTVEKYLTRLGPMDKTAYAIATPSVKSLMRATPSTQDLPTLDLIGGFGCTSCETTTYRQHQWDIEMAIPTPGDSIWMPYVTTAPTGFNTGRLILYRGYTPVWALSRRDTIIMGFLLGRTGKGYVSFRAGSNRIGLRTVKATPKIRAKLVRGRLVVAASVAMTGTLDTWTGPALTPRRIRWIEHRVDAQLSPELFQVMTRLQRLETDPGGWLAPLIWRSRPSWRSASVWESQFRHAQVMVTVTFHLINVGDSN